MKVGETMIRDFVHVAILMVVSMLLLLCGFFYSQSIYNLTTGEQAINEITSVMLMKDRDDSARVSKQTFYLNKNKFEEDIIYEFVRSVGIEKRRTATFIFTYDDGTYPETLSTKDYKVKNLNDRMQETIKYQSKEGQSLKDVSSYSVSDVTLKNFEQNSTSTFKRPAIYNRSIKQVRVYALIDGEKEYQATYLVDIRK